MEADRWWCEEHGFVTGDRLLDHSLCGSILLATPKMIAAIKAEQREADAKIVDHVRHEEATTAEIDEAWNEALTKAAARIRARGEEARP